MRKVSNIKLREETACILATKKSLIIENYINLIKKNSAIEDNSMLKFSIIVMKKIINNFIDCLMSKDLQLDRDVNLLIAHEIAYKNISYHDFIKTTSYFEESCLDILIKEIDEHNLSKCLTLINNLYNETISDISEEYYKINDTTVFALVKLAELRDDTTGSHLERTREYAVLLSKELGLDNKFISNIERASLLHDIGKVGIRDKILLKPSSLNCEEFEEMKKHTLIGADTISQIIRNSNSNSEYLLMAKDIALYHHEKYDGSGYPYGLKGEYIPLSARIFALADAYDAIVSKRPYKEALSHEEAVKKICSASNKHFDPAIIDVFIRIQEEFNIINDKYKEEAEFEMI